MSYNSQTEVSSEPKKYTKFSSSIITEGGKAFNRIVEKDPAFARFDALNSANTIVRSLTLASALISFLLIFVVRFFPAKDWYTGESGTTNQYCGWLLNIANIFNWVTIGLVAAVLALYVAALVIYIIHKENSGKKVQSIIFKFITIAAFGAILGVMIAFQANGTWFAPYKNSSPIDLDIKAGVIFMVLLSALILLLISINASSIMLLFIIASMVCLIFVIVLSFANKVTFLTQDNCYAVNAFYGLGLTLPISFSLILMYTSLNKLVAKNIEGLFKLLVGIALLVFSLITYFNVTNISSGDDVNRFITGTTSLISFALMIVILVFKQSGKLW